MAGQSNNKPLKLKWRPRANLDRQSIAIYLGVECGNPNAALSAINSIDEAIRRIRQFPQLGKRVAHERLANEYRAIQANPYVVYYRITSDAVVIYRVLHQRQEIAAYELVDIEG